MLAHTYPMHKMIHTIHADSLVLAFLHPLFHISDALLISCKILVQNFLS